MRNPLAESSASDPEDRELVRQAQGGNREALERLITRHQAWIYNIVLRMVYLPQDAEDATQEVLVKLITNLSNLRGEEQLSHLAVPHRRQSRAEHEADPGRCGWLDLHAIWRQPGCYARHGPAGSEVRSGRCAAAGGGSQNRLHLGYAAVPRSRATADLHPRRYFRRDRSRWCRAPGDQSRELPAEARAGPARSPQLLARQVRSGQRSESLPVREEDPGLHESRFRGSAEPPVCPGACDARAGRGREEVRGPRRPRRSVRGASPRSSVSRAGGLRDLVEDAHQRNGF